MARPACGVRAFGGVGRSFWGGMWARARGWGTYLLCEEAQRLARLVELAVEGEQQLRALAQKGLQLDHLLLRVRVHAQPQKDVLVARAQLIALGDERLADVLPHLVGEVVGALRQL
eukprot:3825339-Prymnesium_polylepis.1